ncbi:Uncharacterised protein [Mycobacteroides abscessus subsp. abscessus]|nr:Uncharacterised protein [Mycobacteroides abscessus subsp. abscessus]
MRLLTATDDTLDTRTPLVELLPALRPAGRQSRLLPDVGVVVEQRCRPRVWQCPRLVVPLVVAHKRIDVVGGVDVRLAEQVVERRDSTDECEVEPPHVGQDDDVRQRPARERGVELLRRFLVVLSGVDQLDLDTRIGLLEARDQLLLDRRRLARVVRPEGQVVGVTPVVGPL